MLFGLLIITFPNETQNLLVFFLVIIRLAGDVRIYELVSGKIGMDGMIKVNQPTVIGGFNQFPMVCNDVLKVSQHLLFTISIVRGNRQS
jgi:hypothetical protein